MAHWIRFARGSETGFGTLDGDRIAVHEGDMFNGARATGESVALADIRVLTPTEPTKMVALWNNFHQLAAKLDVPEPEEVLFLLKGNNSFAAHGDPIVRPKSYDGKIVYEGELGIVIGRTCKDVSEDEALDYVFGYTCVNDVTAAEILQANPTFPQWTRAKSFDTFGIFGPVVATGLDPASLTVRTVLNGQERQNYPISDMVHPVPSLVSKLSHDMTLEPGDVICVGTSLGVGSMKEAVNEIEIVIDGIGSLRNTLEN